MNSKESFIIYKGFYEPIKDMTDEQLGRLFRAIFNYHLGGRTKVNTDIRMAFDFFLNQFKIDEKKYQAICDKNRENIKKYWDKQKDTTEYNRTDIDKIPTIKTGTINYSELTDGLIEAKKRIRATINI